MLMRQDVECRQKLRPGQVSAFEEDVKKHFEGFQQGFRFLVAVHNNEHRPFGSLIQQRKVKGFCRTRETRYGEGAKLIPSEALQQRLKGGMPGSGLEQVLSCWMDHNE